MRITLKQKIESRLGILAGFADREFTLKQDTPGSVAMYSLIDDQTGRLLADRLDARQMHAWLVGALYGIRLAPYIDRD